MNDDTLHAITSAIEALKHAQDAIERDRSSSDEQRRAMRRHPAAELPDGYHWTVFDDPDAPRFHVSVSKIVPEGGKLPEPTEEGRLLRIEATKDDSEEGGS